LRSNRSSHHSQIELGLVVPATITTKPRQCNPILVEPGHTRCPGLSRFLDPGEQAASEAALDGVATRDVAVEKALSYGSTYLLDQMWRRLELDRSFQIEVERLLFAMVANRAIAPRSKLGLERWVGRKAVIEGLQRGSC
jgi:hypothetical protein